MRGLVFKEHTTETASWAYLVSQMVPGIELFGGIVLNRAVGGINPVDLRAAPEPHADAFQIALAVLAKEGFNQAEIDMMTKTNPARFLGLK